jgi:hypothetical protein
MEMTMPDVGALLDAPKGWKTLDQQVKGLHTYSSNPQKRIRTGLGPIDLLCGGPAIGEVFTFIGRSYSGKSVIAQNIMWRNKDKPIIFFSLEMPALLALQRLYSIWADHPHREVIDAIEGGTVPLELDELPAAFPLQLIVDRSALTAGDMWQYIKDYEQHYGQRPAAIIVDYLEMVGGAKTSGDGWIGTEKVAQEMKELAKDAEVPVFLLHQCNKSQPPWCPPTMDSARGGGYTESDFIVGLWRPHLDPALPEWDRQALSDEVWFNVLKNRARGQHNRTPIVLVMTESLRLVPRDV